MRPSWGRSSPTLVISRRRRDGGAGAKSRRRRDAPPHPAPILPRDTTRVRHGLLNHCERDTWAMVKVLERLRELLTTLI